MPVGISKPHRIQALFGASASVRSSPGYRVQRYQYFSQRLHEFYFFRILSLNPHPLKPVTMRISALLLLAALLSGCAAQRHATFTANADEMAHQTALAALESRRFVIDIDEVYTRKGKRLDTHQSYVRMQGSFVEVSFAPDFFSPRTSHQMDQLRTSDEQGHMEKVTTKRNGDIQFRIHGRWGWQQRRRSCLVTLYHDSDRAFLEFRSERDVAEGTAKGTVRPLDR